jgi:hypothetical protein
MFARMAMKHPGVVPARTLLLLAEQALERLESEAGATLVNPLCALRFAMSVLSLNNMHKQLDQDKAIDLSLRALQYCGTWPCFAACLSLSLP